MACPCRNKIDVIMTCLNCGRSRKYSYNEKTTLKAALKVRKVECLCHDTNWDLDNVEIVNKE